MWYFAGILFIVLVAFWWLKRAARSKARVAPIKEEEAATVQQHTAKYNDFLQSSFDNWTAVTHLPAVGDATGDRLKNQTLTYPYRVLGHWLVIGDDAFYEFCRTQLKMPDAKADELCEALAQKWRILAAHGTAYDKLDATDGTGTTKLAKFVQASFDSVDLKIEKVLPGVGDSMAKKWQEYLGDQKPTTRLLMGHFLHKLSADDDYQRFLKFAIEKVGMRQDYAEDLGEALLEKWQILRKI